MINKLDSFEKLITELIYMFKGTEKEKQNRKRNV